MATIKKVVAKKPLAKKTLAKAQTGKAVSKSKTYNQQLMQKFPKMSAKDTLPENSYARSQFYAPNRYEAAKQKVDRENEFNDEMGESRNRSKKELNTMNKTLDGYVQAKKRGGATKPLAKKQSGGASNDDKGILTPYNRLKSRRVRSADVSSYGSDASVTRTKLNGDKVTKSYKTTNGFVPNSKKTKTVTDKEGNVKSTETSPIDVNKAARKTNRIVNNVGRNKNDSWSVMKKGGAVKKAVVRKKK